jgi:hypothetical protein
MQRDVERLKTENEKLRNANEQLKRQLELAQKVVHDYHYLSQSKGFCPFPQDSICFSCFCIIPVGLQE